MSSVYGFLIDPRGRTDRIGYIAGQLGLFLWLLVLTSFVRLRLDDFTGSGRLIDALWTRDPVAYWTLLGDPQISLNVFVTAGVMALHLLGAWTFLCLTARRLQDMGRPGIYAAAALVVGVPATVLLLAILPGDRAENAWGPARRRFQAPDTSGAGAGVTGPNTR